MLLRRSLADAGLATYRAKNTYKRQRRANALAQRACAFGQSRVVCGVHWQSDVDAGRLVASVAVAQLHANAEFNAQLNEARKEYQSARTAGAPLPQSCAAEASALTK